jgi:hypothetical protein
MTSARARRLRWIAVTLIAPNSVLADDPWTEVGVSMEVGGGVTGAAGEAFHHAGPGLLWTTRLTAGSRRPFALELGYAGAVEDTLSRSIAGVALRVQPWPRATWCPYAFVGAGWQHAELVATSMTMADVGLAADALVVPIGAGVQLRDPHGFVVDARGAVRGGASDAWEASTAIGLEF